MHYKDVVKHFGGVTAAARELGMTRMGVYLWQTKIIPYGRQCQIELLTGGKLKAANGKRK